MPKRFTAGLPTPQAIVAVMARGYFEPLGRAWLFFHRHRVCISHNLCLSYLLNRAWRLSKQWASAQVEIRYRTVRVYQVQIRPARISTAKIDSREYIVYTGFNGHETSAMANSVDTRKSSPKARGQFLISETVQQVQHIP